MVTFNYATIRKDEQGKTFLDLEIQAVLNYQAVIIRNTFPATSDYPELQHIETDKKEDLNPLS